MADHRTRYKQKSDRDDSNEDSEEEKKNDKKEKKRRAKWEKKQKSKNQKKKLQAKNADGEGHTSCTVKRKSEDDPDATKYQKLQNVIFGNTYRLRSRQVGESDTSDVEMEEERKSIERMEVDGEEERAGVWWRLRGRKKTSLEKAGEKRRKEKKKREVRQRKV